MRKPEYIAAKTKLLNMLRMGSNYSYGDYHSFTENEIRLKSGSTSAPVEKFSNYASKGEYFKIRKYSKYKLDFEKLSKGGYGKGITSEGSLQVQAATDFIASAINESIEKNGIKFTLRALNKEIQSERGGIFRLMMAEYAEALNQPDINNVEAKLMAHHFIKSLKLKVSDYESDGYFASEILRKDLGHNVDKNGNYYSAPPDFDKYSGAAETLIEALEKVTF